jgi:hypothetical protein
MIGESVTTYRRIDEQHPPPVSAVPFERWLIAAVAVRYKGILPARKEFPGVYNLIRFDSLRQIRTRRYSFKMHRFGKRLIQDRPSGFAHLES